MLQNRSLIQVVDNTGVRVVRGFWVRGGCRRNGVARIGDVRTSAVKVVRSDSKVKRGEVVRVLIIRTKGRRRSPQGFYQGFTENAGILVTPAGKGEVGSDWVPVGTRIQGVVPRSLRLKGYTQVVSRAEAAV